MKPGSSERLRIYLATHLFSTFTGMTAGAWWRFLRENRFAVDLPSWPRALSLTGMSLLNSLLRLVEEARFGKAVGRTEIAPPIFILGHWRSGTTHLHNLLAADPRFAFPNLYQILYPHHFLSSERTLGRLWANAAPRTRLIDNMSSKFRAPMEEEFALAALSLVSPYLGWAFPRNEERYDRHFLLDEVRDGEREAWKGALVAFLRKLTFKNRGKNPGMDQAAKPLVLKSPPHTARVRLLLELFPGARFVHLRRDPYAVFLSTRRMLEIAHTLANLQRLRPERLDERVLRDYVRLHDRYFAERSLIPAGQLHELAYEDLDRDPLGELERLYRALSLPSFEGARAAVSRHLEKVRGFEKTKHAELTPAMRERIAREWKRSFEEWGYPV